MSANDILDIFGNDVPQTENGHNASESNAVDQSLLEFHNADSNIAGNSLALQNVPGGSLLDFDVGNAASNSASQSGFDVDRNVHSLMLSNTSANTDDVLGIFDTSESIQTKANNSIVDLSGGFSQLEAGACEATADRDLSGFGFQNSDLFQISDSVVVNKNNSLFDLDEIENTAGIQTGFVLSDPNKLGGSIEMDKADISSEDALVSIGQTVSDQYVKPNELNAENVDELLECGKAPVQAAVEQDLSPLNVTSAVGKSGDQSNFFDQSGLISLNIEGNITLQSTNQNSPHDASVSCLLQSEASSTAAEANCDDRVLAATQPSIADEPESAKSPVIATSASDSLGVLLTLSEKPIIDQPQRDHSGLIDLAMCNGKQVDFEEPTTLLPDGDDCHLTEQHDASPVTPTDKNKIVSFELSMMMPQENQLLVVEDNGSAEKDEIYDEHIVHQENAFDKSKQSLLPDLLSHDVYTSELLSNPEKSYNPMSDKDKGSVTVEPSTENLLQDNTLNGKTNKNDGEDILTSERDTGFEFVVGNIAEHSVHTEEGIFGVETGESCHDVESFQPFKNPQANNGTKDYLVVHDEQSNDLLLQDVSSLNVSKKCDTIIEDTLESFNDITTSTDGVDSVGELAFQEGISKHTQYEGDHMIGLSGATTDVRSVMMSDSNEQLLVNQDGALDLCKDENIVNDDTENKDSGCSRNSDASIDSDHSMLEPSESTVTYTESSAFNDMETTSINDVSECALSEGKRLTGDEDKHDTSNITTHTEDDMCNSSATSDLNEDSSFATSMPESKQSVGSPIQIQDEVHILPLDPENNTGLSCQVGIDYVDQMSLSKSETDGPNTCINPVVKDESSVIEHASSEPHGLQIDSDDLMVSPVLMSNDKLEDTRENISGNAPDNEQPSSFVEEEKKAVSFENVEDGSVTDENHSNVFLPEGDFIADSILSTEVYPQKTEETITSDASADITDTDSLEESDNRNADAFENEISTSDLLSGSVATALIGRFVDDIICTAISIVEEELAAEDMSDSSSDNCIDHKEYASDSAVDTNERYETLDTTSAIEDLDEEEESPPVIPVRTKKRNNTNDGNMLDSSDTINLVAVENEEHQISESSPPNQMSDTIEAAPPVIPTRKKKKKATEDENISSGNDNGQACEIVDDSLLKTANTGFNIPEIKGDVNAGQLSEKNEVINMTDDLAMDPVIESSKKIGECNPDMINDNLVEACEIKQQGSWQASSEIVRNNLDSNLKKPSVSASDKTVLVETDFDNIQDMHHTQPYSAREFSAFDPAHKLGDNPRLVMESTSDDDMNILPADRQAIESIQGKESLLKIDENMTSFPKDEESTSFINDVEDERNIGSIGNPSESSDRDILGAEGHDIHDQHMNITTGQESNGEIPPISGLTEVDGSIPSDAEYDSNTAVIISVENSDEVFGEGHLTRDEQDGNQVLSDYRGQYQSPPPLPEADYDELELMHSQSADNIEYVYTEDNEFSSVKVQANTEAQSSSSSIKKSVSLPISFYTNYSSVPSTVFIDKELFSDDGSDAESGSSSSSNDYNPADGNESSFTDEYDDSISQYQSSLKQYGIRQISNQEFTYPELDPEPSTTYEAYDTDWEDIVTDPLRRYSGLPVILEESEPSEIDESETQRETYAFEDADDIITDESLEIKEDDLREESENPVLLQGEHASEIDDQSSLEVNHQIKAEMKLEDVDSESFSSEKQTANQDVSTLDANKVQNELVQNEDGPEDPEAEDTAYSSSDIIKTDNDATCIEISSGSSTYSIDQSIDAAQSQTVDNGTDKNRPTMSARESDNSQGALIAGFETDTEIFPEQLSVLKEDEIRDVAQNADGPIFGSLKFETRAGSDFDQVKDDVVLPASDDAQLVDNAGKNIDDPEIISNEAESTQNIRLVVESGGIEIPEEQQQSFKKAEISQSPSADVINETASTMNTMVVEFGRSDEHIEHQEAVYLSDASVIAENISLNVISDNLEPTKMDRHSISSPDNENVGEGTVRLQFDNEISTSFVTEIPSCNEITMAADVAKTIFGAEDAQHHMNDDDLPAKSDDPKAGNIPNDDMIGEDMIASMDNVKSNMELFTDDLDVGMSLQQSTIAPASQSETYIITAPSQIDSTLGTAGMHHREMDDLLTPNDEEIVTEHQPACDSTLPSLLVTQTMNIGPEMTSDLMEESEASVSSNSSVETSLQNALQNSLPIVPLDATEICSDQQLALNVDKPSKQPDDVLLTEDECFPDLVKENVGNADHNKLQEQSTICNDTECTEIVSTLNTLAGDVDAGEKIKPINMSSEIENASGHQPSIMHAQSDRDVCIISDENSLSEQPNADLSPQSKSIKLSQEVKQSSGTAENAQPHNEQNYLIVNDLEPVQDDPLHGITNTEVITSDKVQSVLHFSSEIDQLHIIGGTETDNEVKVKKEPPDVHVLLTPPITPPGSSNDTNLNSITSEVHSSLDSGNDEEKLPNSIENRECATETSVLTSASEISASEATSEPQTVENLLVAAEHITPPNSGIAFTSEKPTDENMELKEGVVVTKSDKPTQNETTTSEVQVASLIKSQENTLAIDNVENIEEMSGYQHIDDDTNQDIPLTEATDLDSESESTNLQKNTLPVDNVEVASGTPLHQHTESDTDMDSNMPDSEVLSEDTIEIQEPLTDGHVADEDHKVATLVVGMESDIKLSSEIPTLMEVDNIPEPPISSVLQSESFPQAESDLTPLSVMQDNTLAASSDPMFEENKSINFNNFDSDLTEKKAPTPIIPSESVLGDSQPVFSPVMILDTTQKLDVANEKIADIQSVENLQVECQEQTDDSHDKVEHIVNTPQFDTADAEVPQNITQTTNVTSASDADVLHENTSNDRASLETTAILDEDVSAAQSMQMLMPSIHADANADISTVHEPADNILPKFPEVVISVESILSDNDKNVDSLSLEEIDAQQLTPDGETGPLDLNASEIHALQPNDTKQESFNHSEACTKPDINLPQAPRENPEVSNNKSVPHNTSIPNAEDSKALSETVASETHLITDTPPPPPLRKKKKAKREATGELVDNPDQIDLSEGTVTTQTDNIPKVVQPSTDRKNSSELVINNEQATCDEHTEDTRESLISSIIDNSSETKRSADSEISLTLVEANLQAPNVTASSSMLGVSSSEESANTEDDKELSANTEDDKELSSVEMITSADVSELVQPSDDKPAVKSTSQIEESPSDIVREDINVNPIVNKVDRESLPRLPPTIVISDEYGQQNELADDSFLHTEHTGSNISPVDSASDGYSSSEKEYFLSGDDSFGSLDEIVDPMHDYHLIADSVVASIMENLVSSVEEARKSTPSYQHIDGGVDAKPDYGIEDSIPIIEINGEVLPPESLFDVTDQDSEGNDTSVITTVENEDMITTQQEEVNTSKTSVIITSENEDIPTTQQEELNTSSSMSDGLQTKSQDEEYIKHGRQRFDTTGSIRFLTDSEDEDETETSQKSSRLISLEDDTFANDSGNSTPTASQDSDENNRLAAKRKSLVPPSSLVLSVALDEIDLTDKSDIQETPVSQRISLSSSLSSSQTSVASSAGEATGNKRSMLPRLPSLRRKKTPQPVAPEIIKTRYQLVDSKDVIPIVPMPELRRVVKWETVTIKNIEYRIDEALVQPYKRVIAHGGFYDEKSTIIEVFMPYLPATSVQHYDWIMDNIFLYVLATVELLAQGNFSVIIFAGSRNQQPANALLRRWHEHIDYRLKKNVEAFYILNSSFYFRTVAKLFISRKVQRKMKYVKNMAELKTYLPTDFLFVPPEIAK